MFEEPPSGLHQPLMQARQGPLEANSPNPMPMFCVYCHAIGTKESFSKRLPPWSWRFWRIKLIPLIIATAVSLVLPFQTTARLIIGTLLYSFPVLHHLETCEWGQSLPVLPVVALPGDAKKIQLVVGSLIVSPESHVFRSARACSRSSFILSCENGTSSNVKR